jgi:hypothetical protein
MAHSNSMAMGIGSGTNPLGPSALRTASGLPLALHTQHTHTFTSYANVDDRKQQEQYRPGFHQVRREEAILVEGHQRKRSVDPDTAAVVEVDEYGLPLLPANKAMGMDVGIGMEKNSMGDLQVDRSVFIGGGQTGLNAAPRLGVMGKPSTLHENELQQMLAQMKQNQNRAS